MCSWADLRRCGVQAGLAAALLMCSIATLAQSGTGKTFAGIGRSATVQEVAAWDIDVRADFKGLPAGRGSVADGMLLWETKCATCHGVFGESIEFFSPLVGGTTAQDMASGRTASLRNNSFPGRSSLMKLPTVSTLWDYIRRAMPWQQPKSLSVDEVYAVTAYLLNLADVVDAGFVLSNSNMAQVQAKLPNRLGMRTDHAMWPGAAPGSATQRAPDVRATLCMRDCKADVRVVSSIPEHARNDHGNLALQNRWVGAQFGVVTTPNATIAPALAATVPSVQGVPGVPDVPGVPGVPTAVQALLSQHNCTACHGISNKLLGPAFVEVIKKHAATQDAAAYLANRISQGSAGQWGSIAMPAQTLPAADALAIARWLAGQP